MNEIRRERDKMKRAKERKQKKDVAPTCPACIEQTGADGSPSVPLWEGQQTPACETNTPVLSSPLCKIYKKYEKKYFFSQKICIIRKKVLPLHCQTKTIELWQDLLKRKLN